MIRGKNTDLIVNEKGTQMVKGKEIIKLAANKENKLDMAPI